MSIQPGPAMADGDTILSVRNLHTYFYTDLGISRALNGVSFDVPAKKVMGVVGESGCGKSVTALSIMRLVPHPGRIVQGEIHLFRPRNESNSHSLVEDVNLTDLDPHGALIRSIRGADWP